MASGMDTFSEALRVRMEAGKVSGDRATLEKSGRQQIVFWSIGSPRSQTGDTEICTVHLYLYIWKKASHTRE